LSMLGVVVDTYGDILGVRHSMITSCLQEQVFDPHRKDQGLQDKTLYSSMTSAARRSHRHEEERVSGGSSQPVLKRGKRKPCWEAFCVHIVGTSPVVVVVP
jgi:hypothetical protein